MKLKKLLSLFAAAAMGASCLAGFGISASAASESDVKAIGSDYTYWFDDATANGTTGIAGNTLFGAAHFFSSTGNSVAANKGSVKVGGADHLNSLRLKNVQNKLMFKVGAPATITFYTQSHSSRGIVVTNTDLTSAYGTYDAAVTGAGEAKVEPVSTTSWTYTASAAETIYLSSYGGDFFIAGVVVDVKDKEYTTVYDLPALVAGGGIQNTESKLSPSSTDEGSNAPQLTVDATSGKLGPNGDWAQIIENTVITLPRVAKGTKISFSEFYGSTALTIGDVQYNNDNKVFTAAEDGDVVMTCTTGGYIKAITAVGPAFLEAEPEYTTVYDLPALVAGGGIQYKAESLAPSSTDEGSNAPDLIVDATNGKLGPNGDWAQINENTVITLPNVAKGTKIRFSEFYGTTALTIDGTEYNSSNKVYTAAKDGDVVMTCTTGGYIKAVTAVGPAFSEAVATEGYTNTWYFGKSNNAPEFALQRSAEYTYEADGHALVINTDSGKLNNASRTDTWAQCNDGTTFKVPVYAGSKLTWDRYNKGDSAGFAVDEVLYNDYYIAAEDGTVALKAQGISYLASIKIEPVAVYDVTGAVTGGDINGKSVIFTATNGQPYELPVTGGAFSGKLPAGTYSVSLPGDVAYVVDKPSSITVSAAGDLGTIALAEATNQTVSGEITNAPAEAFTLTFTGSGTPVELQLAAGAKSYEVTLAPGTYTVSSSVGTLSPLSQESFTVVKDAVDFDLYYPETLPTATSSAITVGKGETFTSISDALAAVKAANLSAPVITLHSGETYREQVIVDIPDVTFKTDGAAKAKITWYYGIGYSYYSLADNGYYDKDRAMTRHSIKKVEPARWGAAVLVRGSGFKAENIIFENSFNQYYTTEEVKDGVKPSGIQAITVDRQAQTIKADARNATERASAIGFENNLTGCELYKCEFIGSQDTFFTSGSIYVKDCKITGNTDYIFGGGNVVFDNCDLIWGGYSEGAVGGYITAANGGTYVFRDCTIKNGTTSGRTVAGGNLGRDWGGENAHVYYFNTKFASDNTKCQWTNMGGAVESGKADLHIYDFDPDINANYAATGTSGANVNGLLSTAKAIELYYGTAVESDKAPAMDVAEKDAEQSEFTNEEDETDKASLWEATVSAGYTGKRITAVAIAGDKKVSKTVTIDGGISGSVSVYVAVNKAASELDGVAVTIE